MSCLPTRTCCPRSSATTKSWSRRSNRCCCSTRTLPRVDRELGVAYFRMGSFDVAQSYFQKALVANPPPPPEVKQRVDDYLLIAQAIADAPDWTFFSALNIKPTRTSRRPARRSIRQWDRYCSTASSSKPTISISSPTVPCSTPTISAIRNRDDRGRRHGLVNHYTAVGRLDLDFGVVIVTASGFRSCSTRLRSIKLAGSTSGRPRREPVFHTYGAGSAEPRRSGTTSRSDGTFEFRQKIC